MIETNYPRCATCAHWVIDFYGDKVCNFLKDDAGLEFNLFSDCGSPHVISVETPADFGCINHSEITKA